MLSEDENQQLGVGMSETFGLAQKLQALLDENMHLEQHLADMVLRNRVLQSMRSRSQASNGKIRKLLPLEFRRQISSLGMRCRV
jgi:regulator of replication initiation timing